MPFLPIRLLDGNDIPSIAFGTSRAIPKDSVPDCVIQALESGFSHIDTAQVYRSEGGVGEGIRGSQLKREEVYVTTKWSGLADIQESINASLHLSGLSFVDLYLIHFPSLVGPGSKYTHESAWREFEKIKKEGKAKSIGVSNWTIEDLEKVLAIASKGFEPTVNQILFHPYVYADTIKLLEYMKTKGIVAEGYSSLAPLRSYPDSAVTKTVNSIAEELSLKPEQVMLAWVRSKGVIPVTSSSKRERLESYIAAGDIDLSETHIQKIDEAGGQGLPLKYVFQDKLIPMKEKLHERERLMLLLVGLMGIGVGLHSLAKGLGNIL